MMKIRPLLAVHADVRGESTSISKSKKITVKCYPTANVALLATRSTAF